MGDEFERFQREMAALTGGSDDSKKSDLSKVVITKGATINKKNKPYQITIAKKPVSNVPKNTASSYTVSSIPSPKRSRVEPAQKIGDSHNNNQARQYPNPTISNTYHANSYNQAYHNQGAVQRTDTQADHAHKEYKVNHSFQNLKTKKKKGHGNYRYKGGKIWQDKTLDDWPEGDFRIFVGDLGNEVNDDSLAEVFNKYKSFAKAKVIRNKHSKKTKGFGFVSFLDPTDMVKALREMNGKYCGNRPMKLRKSRWEDRNVTSKRGIKRAKKRKVSLY